MNRDIRTTFKKIMIIRTQEKCFSSEVCNVRTDLYINLSKIESIEFGNDLTNIYMDSGIVYTAEGNLKNIEDMPFQYLGELEEVSSKRIKR